jgi:hypothetical protein
LVSSSACVVLISMIVMLRVRQIKFNIVFIDLMFERFQLRVRE